MQTLDCRLYLIRGHRFFQRAADHLNHAASVVNALNLHLPARTALAAKHLLVQRLRMG